MGRKPKDIAGQRFGRLVAVRLEKTDKQSRAIWKCRCDCGGVCLASLGHLQIGSTVSCGCRKREANAENAKRRRKLPHEDYRLGISKRETKHLANNYVKQQVSRTGIKWEDVTQEMIDLKREQLQLFREIRKLKNGLTGKRDTGTPSAE